MEALAIVVGIGLIAVFPFVPGLRPVAKKLASGGLAVAAVTKSAVAVTGGQWKELVAEVQAERNSATNANPALTETIAISLPEPPTEQTL